MASQSLANCLPSNVFRIKKAFVNVLRKLARTNTLESGTSAVYTSRGISNQPAYEAHVHAHKELCMLVMALLWPVFSVGDIYICAPHRCLHVYRYITWVYPSISIGPEYPISRGVIIHGLKYHWNLQVYTIISLVQGMHFGLLIYINCVHRWLKTCNI